MIEYECKHCSYTWNTAYEAQLCCICYICGQKTEQQPCDDCYHDRHCEGCYEVYDGKETEDVMHYGCHEDGLEENTLCHDCWLDRQHPLVQLADCAE